MNVSTSQSGGRPAIDLAGRTALITGGSRGMGRAIGTRFLQAGASVILLARRSDVLAQTKTELDPIAPGKVTAIPCDVTKTDAIAAMWDVVKRGGHRVDILVNNAGTATTGAFESLPDEAWFADFDLKFYSMVRLARLVLPGMRERKWGRIINVVSVNGKTPYGGGAPTVISRAAGLALTKVLAGEYAPHNILVNALCTGLINTDQARTRWGRAGQGLSFEDYLTNVEAKPIPLGRVGEAEEFAGVALFLASDLSSYVTGTAINVDGGLCKVL